MPLESIAIVGSGPSALVVAKRLIENDIPVTILDVGDELPTHIEEKVRSASEVEPSFWPEKLRDELTQNNTINSSAIPKKLVFGSDYIYAKNSGYTTITSPEVDASPTFAKGGYSMAWGAAILPTADCDMTKWPFEKTKMKNKLNHLRGARSAPRKNGLVIK